MTIDYLLIGHMTADLLPGGGRTLGGTVSYAAFTAHAFGLRVGVVTSAAPDEPLLADLTRCAQVQVIAAPATTTFENVYTPAGREQYLRARALPLSVEHIPTAWRAAPAVHFAPVADETDFGATALFGGDSQRMATLQGWLRRWDDGGRVRFKPWSNADVLRRLSVVVFSEEDVREAPELETEIALLAPSLIVTRAERGGTLYTARSAQHYAAPTVTVVHPTGAGDVFATSYLALHIARPLASAQQRLQVAARLAANCVTRYGLEGCPTPSEVSAALVEAGL